MGYLAAATNSAEKHLPSYDNKRKRQQGEQPKLVRPDEKLVQTTQW